MNMKPFQLKAIIDQAQDGDEHSLGQIYDEFFSRIVGYAFRRVLDAEVAQDITANVFLKVLLNLPRFQWRHDQSFNGWIFRIASNEVNSYFRNQQKYRFLAPEDAENVLKNWTLDEDNRAKIEAELDSNQQFMMLHKAVRRLRPKHQEIIHLYYFEHLPHRAVAEAMDMREGAVRTAMHRAQKELKQTLTTDPEFKAYFEGAIL